MLTKDVILIYNDYLIGMYGKIFSCVILQKCKSVKKEKM